MQKYKSAETSLNQIPALFKNVVFERGGINLDWGGGKYNKGIQYMWDTWGIVSLVFDPYNRSEQHNTDVIRFINNHGGSDTATCANVLNVIKEKECRLQLLREIRGHLCYEGKVYISVYEGDRSGMGRETKPGCWQNNMRTECYVDEIAEVFPYVERKGKVIKAWME